MSVFMTPEGGNWTSGRATNYGGEPHDRWSLDTGSCGRGKIDGPKLVTAINTDHTDNTDKCGQCFEVMCVDGPMRGYNTSVFGDDGGVSACRDVGRRSVVVEVTDSCPCVYPANAASNARWCCGGEKLRHFDLSWAAFDVIAYRPKGVIDLLYRRVDCATRKYNITTW